MTASDRHVLEQLSAFIDGDLRPGAEAAVRAHLAGCASCARAIAELRAIVGAARSFERPEPPPTLWPSIEGALARQEGTGGAFLGWRPFAFGTLAGALALALAWTGASWLAGGSPLVALPAASPLADAVLVATRETPADPLLEEAEAEFARAAAAYERSIEKLRGLLARQEPLWSADARAVYAGRLARLDEAIARSRELARRRPGDSTGNEMLFAAYQDKIQFLAAAVHRGAPGLGGGGP
ncbi:MAG TPA: anti-sigma factor [Polyangia bacterium]|nr:anti-sigma factor [Polyangia bacterium]